MQLGIGTSTFTEMCGLAPSRVLGSLSYGAGGWEAASIRMLPTGKVEVVTGTTPHGQGHETAWSQIAADALGVPYEDVEVLHGDTAVAPKGMDTYGSRSLTVGGIAVVKAAEKVIEKARRSRRPMLEADERDLEFAQGTFSVKVRRRRPRPSRRCRWPSSPPTTCPTAWNPRSTPTACSTRRTSRSPTGRTCAPSRSTPRRASRASTATCVRRRRRQRGQPPDRRGPGARRPGSRASPRRCTRRRCTTPRAT